MAADIVSRKFQQESCLGGFSEGLLTCGSSNAGAQQDVASSPAGVFRTSLEVIFNVHVLIKHPFPQVTVAVDLCSTG